jgi:hypothetical protein
MLKKHEYKKKDEFKVNFWKEKSMSYSQISSFLWNKEQWYETYVDPAIFQTSPELEFGSSVDLKLQRDPKFLPQIERLELMQHKMRVVFDGISLVGIPDNLSIKRRLLQDFKTGRNPWTHDLAKKTGQLKIYLLLLYITEKIDPSEFTCSIIWLPTYKTEEDVVNFVKPFAVQKFDVQHTLGEVLSYWKEVKKIRKQMEEYVDKHI